MKPTNMPDFSIYTDATHMAAILNAAVDAIICINERGIVDLFNKAAEDIFQYDASEVIGNNINMLMPEPFHSEHDGYLANYQSSGVKKIIGIGREAIAQRKDGSTFPIDLSVAEAFVANKRVYAGIIRDITTRKHDESELKQHRDHLQSLVEERTRALSEANLALQKLANMDGLTQLANRRNFDETLQREIQRAARNQHPLSLLLCDIDYFKHYNDSYGHPAGDQCLEKVAACMRDSFRRASDFPARYGGEEFAVILPHTDGEEAQRLSQRFLDNINALNLPHSTSGCSDHVTLSIGLVSLVPQPGSDNETLIQSADEALYRAKHSGRNCLQLATPEKSAP